MILKASLIHFLPIEGYPPIQNMINFMSKSGNFTSILVNSTKSTSESNWKTPPTVDIKRRGRVNSKLNLWLTYLSFNVGTLIQLVITQPNYVLYYGTISAFPALVYKLIFNKRARIMVHFHEYVSPKEHKSISLVHRIFYRLEKKFYSRIEFISQTNETRLEKFLEDEGIIKNEKHQGVLPNYPPQNFAQD